MIRRKTMRLKARQMERVETPALTHDELAAKARSLGCPPFCNGWNTETLIRKIKELENGLS